MNNYDVPTVQCWQCNSVYPEGTPTYYVAKIDEHVCWDCIEDWGELYPDGVVR